MVIFQTWLTRDGETYVWRWNDAFRLAASLVDFRDRRGLSFNSIDASLVWAKAMDQVREVGQSLGAR